MRCTLRHITLALALASAWAGSASAHDYCVSTAVGIQNALTAAQTNGEDDTVYIKSGSYPLTAGLTFVSSEAHAIDIRGANDDISVCPPAQAANLAGSGTTLDGQLLVRPLYIANPNGNASVIGVSFIDGRPPSGFSGGGLIVTSSSGNVNVQNCTFSGNRVSGSGASGGAVVAQSGAELSFAQNLLYLNRGTEIGGALLQRTAAGGIVIAQNNTIVGNITDAISAPGGLAIAGSGTFVTQVIDNIIWNNAAAGGSDFGIDSANLRYSNDIGIVTAGSPAPSPPSAGDVSVDPDFAPCSGVLCFNFELKRSSPLVDTGTSPGFTPPTDLAGKPRVIGSTIDIGAFENDTIFDNGFEVP